MTADRLHFQPCAGALGAEVSGIDLCRPVTAELATALEVVLPRYKVLFPGTIPHSAQTRQRLLACAPQDAADYH